MDGMSAKCTTEQFNLLEIMLTGRAAMAVAREVFPEGPMASTRGTVVIATPQGDVHDLGKNITRMVLISKGFRVIDCGKDCPVTEMVAAVGREHAFASWPAGSSVRWSRWCASCADCCASAGSPRSRWWPAEPRSSNARQRR
jgi:dimethylamine corrinoid protein